MAQFKTISGASVRLEAACNNLATTSFPTPGGPEINSLGFLDVAAAEKSVYNALPFRNLSVRGSGSGEDADGGQTTEESGR